jgi:hypothetical protein
MDALGKMPQDQISRLMPVSVVDAFIDRKGKLYFERTLRNG